jgi:uncharacterized protein (DUF849 family)
MLTLKIARNEQATAATATTSEDLPMHPDDEPTPAAPEQLEVLEELIARARAKGLHTGVRDDELQDLDADAAAELIEQLRQGLGDPPPKP